MKISVLICTRNRPQDITWALPSILKNEHDDYEVIVVDQSDGEETQQIVRQYLADHPHLQYVPTTTRGLSFARNLAMSRAVGEVIAFTDDDCETGSHWVSDVANLFSREKNVDMVFGQVHQPDNLPGEDLAVPSLYFNERRILRRDEVFGMGANMSFRRSLLERIGGYDNILGPGAPLACADDFDFTYRAKLAGAQVIADPDIKLIHRAYRTAEQWERVVYLYGLGNAAFFAKHARCGDWWAGRMLVQDLVKSCAKVVLKPVRKHNDRAAYLKGFWQGILTCRSYAVDRHARLYIEKGDKPVATKPAALA